MYSDGMDVAFAFKDFAYNYKAFLPPLHKDKSSNFYKCSILGCTRARLVVSPFQLSNPG